MVDIARDDDEIVNLDMGRVEAGGVADPDVVVLPEGDVSDDFKLPAHAQRREDGTIFLPLSFPVTLKFKKAGVVTEEKTTELVFRRLNGKDMQVITEKPQHKMIVTAMARSIRAPEIKFQAIYERMDATDIDAAGRCVMHFMNGGRPAGG